jgi:F-type H+-transporting ATPase subunit b
MLQIELKWLIVLAVNFLLLLIILNFILFKPLLRIFKTREDTVRGSLDAAKGMNNKREESIARLNRELAEARNKAKEIFDTLKAEGLQKQKEVLSKAEAEADLRAEVEKARKTLRTEIDKFSDEIVRKLVKV